MNKEQQAIEHRSWFDKTFNKSQKDSLNGIGIICNTEHPIFKAEILEIGGYLRNYKLKNYPDLLDKFSSRFVELIPVFLHSKIDINLLQKDIYYVPWFTSRYCFLGNQRKARESALSDGKSTFNREYVLWCPVDDTHCPKECLFHKNKVYHVLDDEFIEYSVDHWTVINRGCRCALISLTESDIKKFIANKTHILSPKLKKVFAQELAQ